jgi:hypothetical protein
LTAWLIINLVYINLLGGDLFIMNRKYKLAALFSFSLLLITGCGSIEKMLDPFVGTWVSGAFNLEFDNDHTFELKIGKTISVNLEGQYVYNEDTLTLNIEGDSEIVFSYEFKDDKNKLVLKPVNESNYFNTKVEFARE